MNVLMLSPGYPAEMAFFTRGLAAVGASVIGVGDQSPAALPSVARQALAHYEPVRSLADDAGVVSSVLELARHVRVDRVECLWEPYMVLAARLREALGVPGMTVAQTLALPGQGADEVGPRRGRPPYAEARERDHGRRHLGGGRADRLPPDGQADRRCRLGRHLPVDSAAGLNDLLPMVRHVPRISVEEFVEAEEFTHDTICADGQVLFENISWYRPRPLVTKVHEWVSPITIALRDIDADAVTSGRISFAIERRYNAASSFKRAQGAGRITHYGGLDRLLAEYGGAVVALDLLPIGAPRRDWRATLISDGMVIVRHPELSRAIEMADRFAADLQLYAASEKPAQSISSGMRWQPLLFEIGPAAGGPTWRRSPLLLCFFVHC